MTPEQQAQFDAMKAGITEIKDLVQNSLNLQANGGYHVFNLALELERKAVKLEASLAAPAAEPTV